MALSSVRTQQQSSEADVNLRLLLRLLLFSSHSFSSTSAIPTLRQHLRALGTAGPQLPQDLNLQPSDHSEHCWTWTWNLATSASSAGPQPPTFRAPLAPLHLYSQIECQKICQIGRKNNFLRVIPTMTFIHVLIGTSWHSISHIFWHSI